MTAEQEAIERLRVWMPHVDRGISWTTSHQADLRALLDSHERLRLALERIRDEGPMTFVAVDIARAALERNNA